MTDNRAAQRRELHEALIRLAGKIEFGALMADTQPAMFIDTGALGHDGYHEHPLHGATIAKALDLLGKRGKP